jgi:hypothetical protein
MMQCIYLSEAPVLTNPPSDQSPEEWKYRYRGTASGSHDDPQGFKRRMASRGHEVIITDEVVGEEVQRPEGGPVTIATREQLASWA